MPICLGGMLEKTTELIRALVDRGWIFMGPSVGIWWGEGGGGGGSRSPKAHK